MEEDQIHDFIFKVVLLGHWGVGKSSLIIRFVDEKFNSNQKSTIGVDFKIKDIKYKDKISKLQIWDTAGQERYRGLTESYIREAKGIFIVFAVNDLDSWKAVTHWMEFVKKIKGLYCVYLICNKMDLDKSMHVVQKKWVENLIKEYHDIDIKYLETSALSGDNVNKAFIQITKDLVEYEIMNDVKQTDDKKELIFLTNNDDKDKEEEIPKKKCCN